MRALLGLLLLVSILSGCTGPGPQDSSLLTARQAFGPATRAAEDWDAGAVLFGASALELDDAARLEMKADLEEQRANLQTARADDEVSEDEYDTASAFLGVFERVAATPDDAPGDGRAPVWVFAYLNEAADAGLTLAVANDDVFFSTEDQAAMARFALDGGLLPVGEWSIDSDDAAEAGKLANPDYALLCTAQDIVASSTLVHGEKGPVWLIGAQRQTAGQTPKEAYLAVDAATGSLVQDEVVAIEEQLYQESGRTPGTLLGAQVSADHEFEIENDGHAQMAVHLAVSPAPAQEVRLTVTDPLGATQSFTVVVGEAPFFAQNSVLLASPPGLYQVHLETLVATRLDYEVSWCTDGIPTSQGDFRPRACDALPDPSGGETLSRLASSVWPW